MIVCKIHGGMGNQMFQYATAISIAKKNNTFSRFLYTENCGTYRPFRLKVFKNLEIEKYINSNEIFQRIEDDFIYRDYVTNEQDLYLDGYWQSEKYFKDNEEEIRNVFEIDEFINYVVPDNSISLHIRRGDYLNSNGYHPIQTMEYYKKALNKVGDYDKLFILSDDITWCKENVIFDNVVFVEGQSEIQDMKVMSLCDHNIIANSSFSWWGAWLNDNPNKKVIAPSKWFGNEPKLNTSDIIPKEWIVL